MIFKCLWLRFPFLSLFLYSQTLKADEVTVGSILLITALPMLLSNHATVVVADWAALRSSHEFQFSFGKPLLTKHPPQMGKKSFSLELYHSPRSEGWRKAERCSRSSQFGSSLTSPLAWVMGTGPVSLLSAPSTPGMRRHRHHSARQGQGREKW